MAKKKIKYPPTAIKKADRKIKKLMKDVIKKKKGGTTKEGKSGPSRTLKRRTGKLQDTIKPVINVNSKGEVEIDISVMEYYQYLDEGTKRIKKPWFLTDEIMSDKKWNEALSELMEAGIEGTTIDILSKLK